MTKDCDTRRACGIGCRIICLALVVCQSVLANEHAYEVVRSWHDDYARIEREMADARAVRGSDPLPIHDEAAGVLPADRDALDVHLRRLEALLTHMADSPSPPDLHDERDSFAQLKRKSDSTDPRKVAERKALFMKSRRLARRIALKNPLLDFDEVIFNTFEHQIDKNNSMNHDQDVGYSAKAGGGIGVIEGFKSDSPTGKNLLRGVRIENGPYRGLEISTAKGSLNSFDLSFDGERIVFAWSRRGKNPGQTMRPFTTDYWHEDTTFHLFTFTIGQQHCRQITFGDRSDHSPCWLPDGRIAFMSERRNTSARCASSSHQPCCTLFSVEDDGSDLIQLSWHDTEEWDPSVNNEGMIVYTRWDYLDRDFHIAHHLWTCYPDGRDPRAPHGNYPLPHTTVEGDRWEDGRAWRPWAEYNIRAIPGSSKYVAIAGGHHYTGVYGAPIILDLRVPDDSRLSQVARITAGSRFIHEAGRPNSAGGPTRLSSGNAREDCEDEALYGFPWPLSEDFYLVAEGPGRYDRVFLLDRFGNREVLYTGFSIPDVTGLHVQRPMPFRARRKPPVIPSGTTQAKLDAGRGSKATISVINVYESDFEWPRGTRITDLRIIQHVAKPWSSPVSDKPPMGYAASPTGRLILGTVPVEEDGSAHFEAPVGKLIYFQALDEDGLAVQSMRSGTYVHPGEHLSCVGCHEDKWRIGSVSAAPQALRRAPSKIVPEVGGVEPVNFYRLVRPVLDKHCTTCHRERKQRPDFSYSSLEPYAFYFHADGGANHLSWLHGGSRTVAGKFGARWSPLYRDGYLSGDHYGVHLADSERRRITLWLDANSLEMPTFSLDRKVREKARRGDLVWPALDVDPSNPQGIEQ